MFLEYHTLETLTSKLDQRVSTLILGSFHEREKKVALGFEPMGSWVGALDNCSAGGLYDVKALCNFAERDHVAEAKMNVSGWCSVVDACFQPLSPALIDSTSSSSLLSSSLACSLCYETMAYPPKTPTRHRSRSETKTPLSSSIFATNNLADASNPFIVASRPASPVKRSTGGSIQVSETLQRQASAGIIRKGGVESRLDVVTRDYVPPPPKSEKRSRSQPSVSISFYLFTSIIFDIVHRGVFVQGVQRILGMFSSHSVSSTTPMTIPSIRRVAEINTSCALVRCFRCWPIVVNYLLASASLTGTRGSHVPHKPPHTMLNGVLALDLQLLYCPLETFLDIIHLRRTSAFDLKEFRRHRGPVRRTYPGPYLQLRNSWLGVFQCPYGGRMKASMDSQRGS